MVLKVVGFLVRVHCNVKGRFLKKKKKNLKTEEDWSAIRGCLLSGAPLNKVKCFHLLAVQHHMSSACGITRQPVFL